MTPRTFRPTGARSTVKPITRIAPMVLGGLMLLANPCCTQMAPPAQDTPSKAQLPPAAIGAVVTELDNQMWIVFQAKDNTYWFGSDGQGLYRYDGKKIVRYTTQDGLAGNHIRGIQEDRAGNIYINHEPGGISRFDGRAFITLRPPADPSKNEWKLEPDDLWFPGGQNSGAVYRYDGKTLHHLEFPRTKAGDDHYAEYPRSKYPAMKYSPYDVYLTFKDSNGHVWFGTATLGVCRFDGKSFAWAAKTEVGFGADDSFGVRSIIEDKDGKFWFTQTSNRYDVEPSPAPGNTQLRFRKEPGIGQNAPIAAFLSALKDKNGHLWLATLGDGVWKYDGKETMHYPVTDDAGAPIWVYTIYKDRQDGLWLGTQHNGVYKFNGTSFEKFKP